MRQVDLQISFLLIRKNGSQCPISHHLACRWWLQKPKQESGLSWSVLLSATVLFTELIEEWECFGFWGDSLANTSRVFILEFIGFILMTLRRKKKSLVKWEGKKKNPPTFQKLASSHLCFSWANGLQWHAEVCVWMLGVHNGDDLIVFNPM